METKQHYIREHMKAAGIGIVELAKRLGQTRQNVYIQIDKSSITLQTLHRIAAALDIEAYRLLLPPDDTRQETHGRPPGSFRGAPDGDKGRGGERANGMAATEHTAVRRSGGGDHEEDTQQAGADGNRGIRQKKR